MKHLITIIYVIIISFTPIFAVANVPTPSPTLTVTPAPTKPEDEKIQDIRQSVKEKVTQIKEAMDKRAFVGVIRDITGETLIITNFRGQQRLNTDETTTFIAANKKEILIRDLAIGDKLIAFGIATDKNELQTVRIHVIAPNKTPPPPVRNTLIGQVLEIDNKKSTLSFANEGSDAATNTYKVDKNSKYSPALSEPLRSINLKQLTIGKRAILIYQEINKILTVKSLFYLE